MNTKMSVCCEHTAFLMYICLVVCVWEWMLSQREGQSVQYGHWQEGDLIYKCGKFMLKTAHVYQCLSCVCLSVVVVA